MATVKRPLIPQAAAVEVSLDGPKDSFGSICIAITFKVLSGMWHHVLPMILVQRIVE